MAKVESATQERIDLLLAQALGAYEELPEVVREIHGWSDAERMSYVYDWFAVGAKGRRAGAQQRQDEPETTQTPRSLRDAVKSHRHEAEFVKSLAA